MNTSLGMDGILAFPWALAALISLPILFAIYLLRRTYRPRTVSSLLLWRDQPEQREGGRRLDRLRTPPSLWWELLILTLLVLAAAAPLLRSDQTQLPLAIVLDDSFSMRAGEAPPASESDQASAPTAEPQAQNSPRTRALEALSELLTNGSYDPVHVILAGDVPQSLGTLPRELRRSDGAFDPQDVRRFLDQRWLAGSATARLETATALAHDLVTDLTAPGGRVLLVTDHAPQEEPAQHRWWAFGRPSPNLAVTQAVRSRSNSSGGGAGADSDAGGEDSCLVQMTYFGASTAGSSEAVQDAYLDVEVEGRPRQRLEVQLTPGEPRSTRFSVPSGQPVRLHLRSSRSATDALAMDSQTLLLPEKVRAVRVALDLEQGRARQLFERALEASGRAQLTGETPQDADLLITDRGPSSDGETMQDDTWVLRLREETQAVSYLGPFVLDRGHPLTDGLALGGVIWGAGRAKGGNVMAGRALISAGDVPLLSDLETATGQHELTLRLRADLSNLDRASDWPVLIWNLLSWRAGEAQGVEQANVRLGDAARLRLPVGHQDDVRVIAPGGAVHDLPAPSGRVLRLPANQPGLHEVRTADLEVRFAVNALDATESDLRRAATGRWGEWQDAAEGAGLGTGAGDWRYRSYAWLLLLVALVLLLLHGWLFLSQREPTSRPSTRIRV